MELIKFSAEWCGPCKALKKTLDNANIKYTEYDADENEKEFELFGIQSVPVLMFVENGREVARLTGNAPLTKIQEFINAHSK